MGPLSWTWVGASAWPRFCVLLPSSKEDRLVRRGPYRPPSGRRGAVIPRHPELGIVRQRLGVPLQFGQVVERVGLVQLACRGLLPVPFSETFVRGWRSS